MTGYTHKIEVGEKTAFVDACDSFLVRQYRWFLGGTKDAYAQTKIDGKTVYMHRLIIAPGPGEYVDHMNSDPLDNRRCNLRIATPSQNCANRASTLNPTGLKGVAVYENGRKYQARCQLEGGVYRGPYRRTAEQAALDYDKLARGVYGSFAVLNFPEAGEQGIERIGGES